MHLTAGRDVTGPCERHHDFGAAGAPRVALVIAGLLASRAVIYTFHSAPRLYFQFNQEQVKLNA